MPTCSLTRAVLVALQVKVALLGPPASGKTTFANELATHYYVDRISAADCVEYAKGLVSTSTVAAVSPASSPDRKLTHLLPMSRISGQ